MALAVTAASATVARAQEQEQKPPPETHVETVVTVTATRLPYEPDDITASTRTVAAGELRLRPGTGLDEALRWIPEVSLFRRAPARAAHPTTHGVNLRGLAPSGTSRALVLVDGVPLADAFGGWVQWDRVPVEALERVEIGLGGGAAPFGNQALAGTIQLITRAVGSGPAWRVHGRGGTDATWQAGVAASGEVGGAGLLAAGHAVRTDGYVGTAPESRGTIDRPLASRAASGLLKLELRGGWRLTADAFAAHRDNGTPLQANRVGGYGAALARVPGSAGASSGLAATVFAHRSALDSVFTAVDAGRSTEVAVLDQHVPSTDLGASVSGWRSPTGSLRLAMGADVRRVRGSSREDVLLAGITREPGGTQTIGGAWASTRLAPPGSRWVVEASLRGDAWRQSPRLAGDPARDGRALSPRLGLLWRASRSWTLRASGYGAFRAPTLNELYRQFRVGDVITAANASLREERLHGIEAGAVWSARAGSAAVRIEATGFWNRLDDAVANATVNVREGLVLRERRNLGSARVGGLELNTRIGVGRVHGGLSVTLLETRVLSGPEEAGAEVTGRRLPQVPGWRMTTSATYRTPGGIAAAIGVHATGRQFEDDLNQLTLASGATVDLALDWPLPWLPDRRLSLGLYAQNLLGARLQVARTPTLVLGPPRSLSVGLALSPDG